MTLPAHHLCVAPMLDWTVRECRLFHRHLSRRALLYTEMVTAPAILHGDRARLLDFDAAEHPLALQVGGSDPRELAQASAIAAAWGYDEINLNCGCPSDRVQSGAFGAVLMRDPDLVGACLAAMQVPGGPEVTLKCRIGVDEQDPRAALPAVLAAAAGAGVRRVIVHARKAWLQGLSPKDNREIPPLDHALVLEMARAFPTLEIVINGGIDGLAQAGALMAQGPLAGAMLGRAAYHEPWAVLGAADALWGAAPPFAAPLAAAEAFRPAIAAHLARGGRLHAMTRHMLGLFHARPGARLWKRTLSEGAPRGGLEVYDAALAAVRAATQAATQAQADAAP